MWSGTSSDCSSSCETSGAIASARSNSVSNGALLFTAVQLRVVLSHPSRIVVIQFEFESDFNSNNECYLTVLNRQRQYTPKICPSMSPYYVLEFSDYYRGNVRSIVLASFLSHLLYFDLNMILITLTV